MSMLHNTWLIAKREYVERIRAKSFIVMTVLIPTLMGGDFWRGRDEPQRGSKRM